MPIQDEDFKLHHTQKGSDEEVNKRHASVLLAKTPEELEAAYDEWAPLYEDDLATITGEGTNVGGICSARILVQKFSAKPDSSNSMHILDFGCGTGIAGTYIKNHKDWSDDKSYCIDAVDLSQGMLDLAAKRNVYRRLIKATFESSCVQEDEYYDIVHSAGVFAPGQAPPSTFDEFLRVLKKGGHAIFTVRKGYYDGDEGADHRKYLEQLVQARKWEQVACTEEPYIPKDDITAYVFIMKKV